MILRTTLVIITVFSIAVKCDVEDLQQQTNDSIDPLIDQDVTEKELNKRTIFKPNINNFGWAKHVRFRGGQKVVLGYSPVDLKYIPVVKPLRLKPVMGGWKFKPKPQQRPKPVLQLVPVKPIHKPVFQTDNGWKPIIPAHVPAPPHVDIKPWQEQGWVSKPAVTVLKPVPAIQQPPVTTVLKPLRPSQIDHHHIDEVHHVDQVHHSFHHAHHVHDLHVHQQPQFVYYNPLLQVQKPQLPVLPLGATFPSPILPQPVVPHVHVPQVHEIPQEEIPINPLPLPQFAYGQIPGIHNIHVPHLHAVAQVPHVHEVPQVTHVHAIPQVPHFHNIPHIHGPDVHALPETPHFHAIPQLPHVHPLSQVPHIHPLSQIPHIHPLSQLPHVHGIAQVPHIHEVPQIPHVHAIPQVPHIHPLSQFPHVDTIPQVPHFHALPQQPHVHPVPQSPHVDIAANVHPFQQQPHVHLNPNAYPVPHINGHAYPHTHNAYPVPHTDVHSYQHIDVASQVPHTDLHTHNSQAPHVTQNLHTHLQSYPHIDTPSQAAYIHPQQELPNQIPHNHQQHPSGATSVEFHGKHAHLINHLFTPAHSDIPAPTTHQHLTQLENYNPDILPGGNGHPQDISNFYQHVHNAGNSEDAEQQHEEPQNGLHPGYTDLQLPVHLPQHPNYRPYDLQGVFQEDDALAKQSSDLETPVN